MTPDTGDRYSRQIRFPGIGESGQARIQEAHVAVVGCGALGSFHAGALARAGVGKITLIDRDYVEWSNLQRQWLFTEQDACDGLPKAVAASRAIAAINSSCQVEVAVKDLTPANIEDILADVHLILDGTDNFETRYLLNDYAVRERVPWLYGAAVGSYGIVMPVIPDRSACLACVYPEPPSGAQPTCETAGVLGPLTSAVASFQVAMALKVLVTCDAPRRIFTLDVWEGAVRHVDMPDRDPACPACGLHEYRYLNQSRRTPISLCGRNAVQIHERTRPLDLEQLRRDLAPLGQVRANEFALRFAVGPYEMTIFPDGRAIIKGTNDIGIARSLYSRYIGN